MRYFKLLPRRRFDFSRFVGLLLISILINGAVSGQSIYKAKQISLAGKKIRAESINIAVRSETVDLQESGTDKSIQSIPFDTIKNIEYTFSRSPSYGVGTAAIVLIGVTGLPLLFNSTKKNWLTVNSIESSIVFQLESENYRMLLLDLSNHGVSVVDLGDPKEIKKNAAKKKKDKH